MVFEKPACPCRLSIGPEQGPARALWRAGAQAQPGFHEGAEAWAGEGPGSSLSKHSRPDTMLCQVPPVRRVGTRRHAGHGLCTEQTDGERCRYPDAAGEHPAETWIKGDGFSARKRAEPWIHPTDASCFPHLDSHGKGCVVYDSVCRIPWQRQNSGGRSQRQLPGPGREGAVGKGGPDYESRESSGQRPGEAVLFPVTPVVVVTQLRM